MEVLLKIINPMMINKTLGIFIVVVSFLMIGCGGLERNSKATYFLLDTSGSYPDELKKAQSFINYLIANYKPNDSFSVARLDSSLFSEQDVVTSADFAFRPSLANSQKRVVADAVNTFVKTVDNSAYSDVGGAFIYAVEHLRLAPSGHKTIMIFTDLFDSVPVELVEDSKVDFTGIKVVTISAPDYSQEQQKSYRLLQGLTAWEQLVTSRGGTWQVVFDLSEKEKLLPSI